MEDTANSDEFIARNEISTPELRQLARSVTEIFNSLHQNQMEIKQADDELQKRRADERRDFHAQRERQSDKVLYAVCFFVFVAFVAIVFWFNDKNTFVQFIMAAVGFAAGYSIARMKS